MIPKVGWTAWLSLHRSDLFAGELARFVRERLREAESSWVAGRGTLSFEERGEPVNVEIRYLVEEFPAGRVFHVPGIRSPEDPPQPPRDR